MRRREFISLFGSTVIARPLVARAQQSAIPVIGWLSSMSAEVSKPLLAAFRKALADAGYVEGQNVESNIAGQTETMIGCRRWRPIWSGGA